MKITFLGIGEAFDENYPNNSHLLTTEKTNLLVDCGYSIPQQYWKQGHSADFLDTIYISHQHGDHFLGLPAILTRLWEEKRTKPLTIISQPKVTEFLYKFLDMAYQGFHKKFQFAINFVPAKPGKSLILQDLSLSFAPTIHSIENLAIKVSDGSKSYCYSGDGQFIAETEALYKNSDLVIQETYLYDEKKIGHACITDTIEMAERLNVKQVALTHMQRDFRRNELPRLRDKIVSQKVNILIPEPLDSIEL